MGFWKDVRCPFCGKDGAKKFLWMVKCPMRSCPNYDHALAAGEQQSSPSSSGEERSVVQHAGNFDPGECAVTIFYTNHQGEEREFVADWRTLTEAGWHVSACIMPTGTRCAFKASKIDNMAELEPYMEILRALNKTEKRILARYLAHGFDNPRIPAILEKIA